MTTKNIFGFNFIRDVSYNVLADTIIDGINLNTLGITNLATPNAHIITELYFKHKKLNKFLKTSKFILPDGQPIVWLSKFTKSPIKKRLTGSDFFPVIFNKLKEEKYRCLFVVSDLALKDKFMLEKPNAVYIVPDFFEINEAEKTSSLVSLIVNEIQGHNINYVFMGISCPKQETLSNDISVKLREYNYPNSCVFFMLGASFEFYFGMKKRAPLFFQRLGLEWLHRLWKEPRRTYKRYIYGNLVFLFLCAKWVFHKKSFE